MKKPVELSELASMVMVRNHLSALVNGPRHLVSKQDIQPLNKFITYLDNTIVRESLSLATAVSIVDAGAGDEEDIAKKIAEAKSKMSESKAAVEQKAQAKVSATKPKKPASFKRSDEAVDKSEDLE